VAFWSWVVAAVLLLLGGMSELWVGFTLHYTGPGGDERIRSLLYYLRGVGALCIALGIAIGYLARRTRAGDKRFRRATVALSIATVILVLAGEILLEFVSLIAVLAVIPLLVAIVAATRDSASAWFDAVASGSSDD
jgi:hypothetical protein